MLPYHDMKERLRKRRRKLLDAGMVLALRRKRLILQACLMAATTLQSLNSTFRYSRYRRLQRNTGW